jgi:outer membrane protein assembly factor BamB
VDINANPAAPGPHLLLVTVESSDGDYQPALTGFTSDAALAAYMRTLTIVSDIVPSDSSITITYPDKREFLLFDCPIIITWEWTGAIDNVKIEYSTDGFVSDINTIVDSTLCDGAFHWAPPDLNTDTFRIRISNVDNPSVFDISDEDSSVLDQSPAIWKTQKYDYARSGISPNYGPATNNLLWEVPVSSEMTPSPSIGSDGTIYVGTNDGYLYAVTPDGTILWNLKLGLFVLGSPTITGDGRIYAGSWGGATGYLHAIECDGDIVWEFDMGQNINHTSAAVGDDGTIYISNNGGKFFAINPDGTEKWSFVAGGSYIPSPALGNDGSIYLCTTGGNGYGVTDNGQGSYTIFWQHNFSSDHLGCPPSVDENNVVYITGLYQDTLWACDPFTDTILWTGSMGGGCSETSATVGPDGTVYIGCNDGNVYAFTPPETGTEASVKWTFPTGNQVTASPVLDPDGRLYVPSRDFFIYCLDSTDGSEIWKYETGDIIRSEVAIAPGGTMYVGGHDAILRAFRDE